MLKRCINFASGIYPTPEDDYCLSKISFVMGISTLQMFDYTVLAARTLWMKYKGIWLLR